MKAHCPTWCTEAHDDGERRHLAELRDVVVTADRSAEHTPRLFADLRQAPGEDRPLIHVECDETPVARLQLAEAAAFGAKLVELVKVASQA